MTKIEILVICCLQENKYFHPRRINKLRVIKLLMKHFLNYTAAILLSQILACTSPASDAQVSFKKHIISSKFVSEGAAVGDANHMEK